MNIAAIVVVTIADTNTEMKVATTTTVKIKARYWHREQDMQVLAVIKSFPLMSIGIHAFSAVPGILQYIDSKQLNFRHFMTMMWDLSEFCDIPMQAPSVLTYKTKN